MLRFRSSRRAFAHFVKPVHHDVEIILFVFFLRYGCDESLVIRDNGQYKFEPLPRGHHRILRLSGILFQLTDFFLPPAAARSLSASKPIPFRPLMPVRPTLRSLYPEFLPYGKNSGYNCCQSVGICDGFHWFRVPYKKANAYTATTSSPSRIPSESVSAKFGFVP
jgi:hypothetical protein